MGADLGAISLKLVPQISSVKDKSEWVTYDLGGTNTVSIPIFSREKIDTEVNVHSGETVVMGGLAQTTHSKSTTGVPFLSSLPWIGYLFRSDADSDTVDNLIIFVTATILADTGEELIPLNASELPGLPVAGNGK